MPVKRRLGKQRPKLPDAIEGLQHGKPIEPTEQNRQLLVAAVYFGDYPDLSPTAIDRAASLLGQWSDLVLP